MHYKVQRQSDMCFVCSSTFSKLPRRGDFTASCINKPKLAKSKLNLSAFTFHATIYSPWRANVIAKKVTMQETQVQGPKKGKAIVQMQLFAPTVSKYYT